MNLKKIMVGKVHITVNFDTKTIYVGLNPDTEYKNKRLQKYKVIKDNRFYMKNEVVAVIFAIDQLM